LVKDITNVKIVCTQLYSIGGRISGLIPNTDGVILINTISREAVFLTMNGNWEFPNHYPTGTQYNVQVSQQPKSQTCVVNGGNGTIQDADIINITVVCV